MDAQDLAGDPTPQQMEYNVAPMTVSHTTPVISSPLRGSRWVDINGCCETDGVHRKAVLPVDGSLFDGQRYAIDWARLHSNGQIADGPLDDVHSYAEYGAPIYAVANGTVVDVVNDQPNQVPPNLPDPHTNRRHGGRKPRRVISTVRVPTAIAPISGRGIAELAVDHAGPDIHRLVRACLESWGK